MNEDDYPLVRFKDIWLRRVPELPTPDAANSRGGDNCAMCLAHRNGEHDHTLCHNLAELQDGFCRLVPHDEQSKPCIYIHETEWDDYLVERVRRRIS